MSTTTRVALVIGLLCLLGAGLATFLPASPSGATCGTWVAPEWTDEKTAAIVERAGKLADQSLSGELAGEGVGIAVSARAAHDLCADALSTRRTTTIVLLVLAAAVPAGVIFVGGSRRRETAGQA